MNLDTGTLCGAIALLTFSCAASEPPELRNGDIIFHTSTSQQSACLQKLMNSPYTHMGVVYVEDGATYVYEAVQPVKRTLLGDWIARGVGERYVVKRLIDAEQRLTDEVLARMREIGRGYQGKSYDPYFQWSDERIYCSELVWKMYEQAVGVEIGELQRFRDFDLSDEACAAIIKARYPGGVCPPSIKPDTTCIDPEEPVISPAAMFEADNLETVFEN